MSRVHRLLTADRIFFVTVRLRRALAPLKAGEYRLVAAAMNESRRRLGFLLCGYVLMPDHWHALISTAYPLTISQVMQNIKWMSARSLNDQRGASGAVWQHQFWDRFVRHEKEFAGRFEYMHLNPVRKGLVRKPEEWHWSSYHNFALDKKKSHGTNPVPWLPATGLFIPASQPRVAVLPGLCASAESELKNRGPQNRRSALLYALASMRGGVYPLAFRKRHKSSIASR